MFSVIDRYSPRYHNQTLRSFAELRYEIFIKRLGWPLDCEEGNEQDQFDTEDATYLTVSNRRGQVVAGARLLDTSRQNLLRDVFSHLVDDEPPASSRIFDVTRFAVDHRKDRLEGCGNPCGTLLCGIQEFALQQGLTSLVSVSDVRMEPILRRAGYKFRRMGQSVQMDGTGVVALTHEVSPSILADCRRRTGISHALINTQIQEAA